MINWTEDQKKEALREGYVCCDYYFMCWNDPPPYERGACCKHMQDYRMCQACKKTFFEKIKKYKEAMKPTEKKRIELAFRTFVEGNDCFDEDTPKPEMEHFSFIFETAWILGRLEGFMR